MPEITAYADLFRDWEGLIGACIQKAHLVPGLESLRANLEVTLSLVRDLKIKQEDLTGSRLATTQNLLQAVDEGREQARKIRNFVKSVLGTRSEHLVQFGLTPNRPKSRNKAKPSTPPAPGSGTTPPPPADGGSPPPSVTPQTEGGTTNPPPATPATPKPAA